VFPALFLVTKLGGGMKPNEVAERACGLPAAFYDGSKSMVQLIKELGIGERLNLLTVDNVHDCIARHPDLVEQWLRWSANKRVTSGWYFTRQGDEYEVGFYPDGKVMTMDDAAFACAEFVIREVNAIAASVRPT
jgi:hypothetical protein